MRTRFGSILGLFLAETPVYLVCVAGVILAIVYWKRSSRAAALLLCGAIVLMGASFVGTWLNATLSFAMASRPVLVLLHSLISAVGYGLLVAAALVDRPNN